MALHDIRKTIKELDRMISRSKSEDSKIILESAKFYLLFYAEKLSKDLNYY